MQHDSCRPIARTHRLQGFVLVRGHVHRPATPRTHHGDIQVEDLHHAKRKAHIQAWTPQDAGEA